MYRARSTSPGSVVAFADELWTMRIVRLFSLMLCYSQLPLCPLHAVPGLADAAVLSYQAFEALGCVQIEISTIG